MNAPAPTPGAPGVINANATPPITPPRRPFAALALELLDTMLEVLLGVVFHVRLRIVTNREGEEVGFVLESCGEEWKWLEKFTKAFWFHHHTWGTIVITLKKHAVLEVLPPLRTQDGLYEIPIPAPLSQQVHLPEHYSKMFQTIRISHVFAAQFTHPGYVDLAGDVLLKCTYDVTRPLSASDAITVSDHALAVHEDCEHNIKPTHALALIDMVACFKSEINHSLNKLEVTFNDVTRSDGSDSVPMEGEVQSIMEMVRANAPEMNIWAGNYYRRSTDHVPIVYHFDTYANELLRQSGDKVDNWREITSEELEIMAEDADYDTYEEAFVIPMDDADWGRLRANLLHELIEQGERERLLEYRALLPSEVWLNMSEAALQEE